MPSKKAPTLYWIWSHAAKELKQIKNRFGTERTGACALGAIAYYDPDRKVKSLDGWTWDDMAAKVEIFEEKVGIIPVLNDEDGWTFKQFAKKAKEIGV